MDLEVGRESKKRKRSSSKYNKTEDQQLSQSNEEESEKEDIEEEGDDDDDSVDKDEEEQWRQEAEKARRKKRKVAAQLAGVQDLSSSDDDSAADDDKLGEAHPTIEDQIDHRETLEPFNLKEEIRDRVINPDRGSVNNKAQEDDEVWLQEFDQKLKDNRQFAHQMAELSKTAIPAIADDEDIPQLSPYQKLKTLEETSDLLLWGENVVTALSRLTPKNNAHKTAKKKTNEEPTVEVEEAASPFDQLAGKVDILLSQLNIAQIYEMTKEDLLDKLDTFKADLVRWEYKWQGVKAEGSEEDKLYGPFTVEEMTGWRSAGYFEEKEGEAPLVVRQLVDGEPRGEFIPVGVAEFDRLY